MQNNIDAIIFDMDGLLVDSDPAWEQAVADTIEAYGHSFDPDSVEGFYAAEPETFLRGLRDTYGIETDLPTLSEKLVAAMLELIPTAVQPRPGAQELLAYATMTRTARAIASTSPPVVIDRILSAQNWEEIFDVRCSDNEVDNGKPAPDVYLLAAERLGVEPSRCLALEDRAVGAQAAVAAGMTCYVVPGSDQDDFSDITPHVYESLHDVLGRLQSL